MVVAVSSSWEIYVYANMCVSEDNLRNGSYANSGKWWCQNGLWWNLCVIFYLNYKSQGSWVGGIARVGHKRQALCMVVKAVLVGYGFSSDRSGAWRLLDTWKYRKLTGGLYEGV